VLAKSSTIQIIMAPPVSVPIKLLHEAIGHTVTIEARTGELYRGHLLHSEDNMNCLLENVVRTNRDGSKTAMEQVFIRGSQVRFFVVPDMLKHAPMFKNLLKQSPPAGAPPKGSAFGTLQPGKGKGGKGGFRR
jgi:small nuclear ribonucleoprotein D3